MSLQLSYLLLGIFTAIVGAIPLGAVNLAVITTSVKENTKKASRITLSAGIGEVLLAVFALYFGLELSYFFHENQWVQILFIVLFIIVGTYFLLLKKEKRTNRQYGKSKIFNSKFITGFSLAVLNPPVIIYWILAISLINKYLFELTTQNSITSLLFFFTGIYLGKTGTLYLYGKWGNKIAQRQKSSDSKLSKIIGIALLIIAFLQGMKLILE